MNDQDIKSYANLLAFVLLAGIWIEAYRLKFRQYKTVFGGHPILLLVGLFLILAMTGVLGMIVALGYFLYLRKKIKSGALLPKDQK